MDPYTPLFTLLRPGREHCKVAIECELGTRDSKAPLPSVDASLAAADAALSSSDSPYSASDKSGARRIFALVTNVESGYEQACLFVLQRRSHDPQRARIVDGLPILPGFQTEVRQVSASVANDDVAIASAAAAAATAAAGTPTSSSQSSSLQLDMTLAGKTISAVSSDAQAVRDLTNVLRQLTGMAEAHDWTPTSQSSQARPSKASHAWVEHYMHVEREPAVSSSKETPIFSRFTTSAFVRPSPSPVRPYTRPRDRSPGPDEVKVSIGTFNVNGQVPDPSTSASLNAWLHAAEDEPDILVVGIEEADSSGLSYVMWTPRVEAAWSQAIERALAAPRTRHHDDDDTEDDHHHNSDDAYVKLTSKQLVGVLTLVFVRTRLLSRIEDPAVASVGVGLGGWAANKGAAAVRMRIDSTNICFVVAHLSAFSTPEARERRRWDYHEIIRRLKFVFLHDARDEVAVRRLPAAAVTATTSSDVAPSTSSLDEKESAAMSKLRAQLARSSEMSTDDAKQTQTEKQQQHQDPQQHQHQHQHQRHHHHHQHRHVRHAVANGEDKPIVATDVELGVGDDDRDTESRSSGSDDEDDELQLQRWSILDHDVVFWAGDLNWRIDLGIGEVKRLIGMSPSQYEETLLKFDQLRGELSSKASFTGFQEQTITFAPTYKFDRGTDDYDTSEKQRCPAWTDRVLWYEKDIEPSPKGIYDMADKEHAPTTKDKRGRVQPLRYESAPTIRLSDHKPVLAAFLVRTATGSEA